MIFIKVHNLQFFLRNHPKQKANADKGAVIYTGSDGKVITTDESGTANILLENGEYTYTLNKANWIQQTGEFVVLNGPIFITINNFEATPYKVTFTIYEGEAPMEGAEIKIGINTLETDDTGIASVDLEPGTYSYTVSKAGFKTIDLRYKMPG